MYLYLLPIGLLLFIQWLSVTLAQEIASTLYPYIYTDINNWPCVRLLNATGTIGCHALYGSSGILYQVLSQVELNEFVDSYSGSDEFYTIVLPYHLLTNDNIHALDSTRSVGGVVTLLRGSLLVPEGSFASLDTSCPNCQYGLYAKDPDQYIWNPQAQGILEENLPFPVFGINPIDGDSINAYNAIMKAIAYNIQRRYTNYPLQSMDIQLFMWSAINSETCLRRGWCQVVGGASVYSSPSHTISAEDGKKIIVLTAPLDSRSLFHDLTDGINNPLSGLIAMLTVADALSRSPLSFESLKKNIVYTAFTAEAWGFAGSQRFVQDITTPFQCTNATRAFPCPYTNAPCTNPCIRSMNFQRIQFNNIDTIIEFSSVSGINSNYTGYWAHVDAIDQTKPLVDMLQQMNLTLPGPNANPTIQSAYGNSTLKKLPPSSAMSFLSKRRDINAVVLSDYQTELGNYYNSDMDDAVDLVSMAQSICSLSDVTAKSVFLQAQQGASDITPASVISANCTLVTSLLDCLANNFSCPYMQQYFNTSNVGRMSHYASALSFQNPQPHLLSRFVFAFLADITGITRNDTNGNPVGCATINDCNIGEYCIKQHCVSTITAYHDAYGTGLTFNETTGAITVTDPTKGTWTESTWDTPSMRIFLVTSRRQQVIELVVGVLWIACCIASVIAVQHYMRRNFKEE